MITLGDQFSNNKPSLNQPDTAQASTKGDEATGKTSLLASADFGSPFESIASQVSKATSSSSVPSSHVESTVRIATEPSRYSPFQKNWGPSSSAGPATTDTKSAVSIPTLSTKAGASDKTDTEAKQRALLKARLEQDQRRKDRSDTEAK